MKNVVANNSHYKQGLYIPKYKDKAINKNDRGGYWYRSSLEYKMMIYLDHNEKVTKWCSEGMEIPYISKEYVDGMVENKRRRYYPDFYYEMQLSDGNIKRVIAEVKPMSEFNDVVLFQEGKFNVPDKATSKGLKNLEYKFKMAQKNSSKWETMIEFCRLKGMHFVVITEEHLKRYGL